MGIAHLLLPCSGSDFSRRVNHTSFIPHKMNLTVPRHLSRYTAARTSQGFEETSKPVSSTMHPRQPNIEARSLADETSAGMDRGDFKLSKKTIGGKTSNQKSLPIPALLNLTVNFFPRTSFGTNVLEKYSYIYICLEFYRQDFLVEPRILNCLGALLCTKLQQFLARFYVQNYYTTAQHLAT